MAVLVLLTVAACGGEPPRSETTAPPASPRPTGTASPETSPPAETASPERPALSEVRLALDRVATLGAPLAMAVRAGDDSLYFAEQHGLVTAVPPGGDPETILDLSGQITSGGERGLLGLAFSPDGGFLYVNFTDANGDTRVVEYRSAGGRPDPGTARELLRIDQPFSNHNGGNVAFGPDGHLYIGMGDGGGQGDPQGNGQDLGALLAKMLRIDPRPGGGRPYGIPADNPFVNRGGARPEIWAYGLRNPWRWSFDRETGDLWIGDVGGSAEEEIDFQPAGSGGGENYGWSRVEGTVEHADPPPEAVGPVLTYPTGEGGTCAVTGGYVYRGSAIPDLEGAYLYADFCGGAVRALRLEGGRVVDRADTGLHVDLLASFGEDHDGELYVLSLRGDVFRIVAG